MEITLFFTIIGNLYNSWLFVWFASLKSTTRSFTFIPASQVGLSCVTSLIKANGVKVKISFIGCSIFLS